MGGGSDMIVGFKYLFGIHMGIGRGPVDELIEIKVGDKSAWRGSITTNGQTLIDVPDLFGGEKGEGGIQGNLTAMFGGPDQVADPALATVLQSPMPGFRRMFTVFFDGIISMMNPYPKAWKFRVRRSLNGWDGDPWYPEKARISLVRPVSVGESYTTSETITIASTFTGIPVPLDPDVTWQFTIVPDGPILAITSMYVDLVIQTTDAGEIYQPYYLVEGVDYVRVDNEIYLFSVPGPTYPTTYNNDIPVHVSYTYTVTTVDPLGGVSGDGLIQSMNPVHIIYECLTNREWGRGLDRVMIDDANWRYAADKAFTEQFGLCIRWNRSDEIKSFIQSILDHIGAVVYDDRKTAKLKIKLIRDDYDKNDLPLFDRNTGLLEVREASVSALGGMINEIRVTYHDPVTDEDRTVRASNLAALQAARGAINSMSKNYPGIPTAEIAAKVAKRDLRSLSPAIRRFAFDLDRRGYGVTPGAVIRIQDLSRGIPDMIVRVATCDYGRLGEGKITIQALQDVFGLPRRGYTTIGPPQWRPPSGKPCVGLSESFEMPYRSMYRAFSPADFDYINQEAAYLGVVAQEGQPLNGSFNIAVRSGAVDETQDFPSDDSYICGA